LQREIYHLLENNGNTKKQAKADFRRKNKIKITPSSTKLEAFFILTDSAADVSLMNEVLALIPN